MRHRLLSGVYILFIIFLGLIAAYLTSATISIYQGYRQAQVLNKKNIYMGNNQLTDAQYSKLKNDSINNKKAHKIFKYINHNFDYAISWEKEINGQPQLVTTNLKFLQLYNIEVSKGRRLNKDDLLVKDTIPVLIGSDLQTEYPIGKKFVLANKNYKSIGILNKHSQVPSVYLFQNQWDLDNSVIIPLTKELQNKITSNELISSIQNLVLLNTNKTETSKLAKLFQDNGMNVKFYTAKSNINETTEYVKNGLLKILIVYLIVMIISIILGYFAKGRKEIFKNYLISGVLWIILEIILGVSGSIFGISYATESSGINWIISILAVVVSWSIVIAIVKLLTIVYKTK